MIHHGKCKFCGYALDLDIADDFIGHSKKPLDWWIAMAVCNRCADYKARLRANVDTVLRLCNSWAIVTAAGSDRDRSRAATSTEQALVIATKKLAETLSRHWKATNPWDREFVEILMAKPAAGAAAVRVFIRHVEKAGELFGREEAIV